MSASVVRIPLEAIVRWPSAVALVEHARSTGVPLTPAEIRQAERDAALAMDRWAQRFAPSALEDPADVETLHEFAAYYHANLAQPVVIIEDVEPTVERGDHAAGVVDDMLRASLVELAEAAELEFRGK